jgi:hypothetical protein
LRGVSAHVEMGSFRVDGRSDTIQSIRDDTGADTVSFQSRCQGAKKQRGDMLLTGCT